MPVMVVDRCRQSAEQAWRAGLGARIGGALASRSRGRPRPQGKQGERGGQQGFLEHSIATRQAIECPQPSKNRPAASPSLSPSPRRSRPQHPPDFQVPPRSHQLGIAEQPRDRRIGKKARTAHRLHRLMRLPSPVPRHRGSRPPHPAGSRRPGRGPSTCRHRRGRNSSRCMSAILPCMSWNDPMGWPNFAFGRRT